MLWKPNKSSSSWNNYCKRHDKETNNYIYSLQVQLNRLEKEIAELREYVKLVMDKKEEK